MVIPASTSLEFMMEVKPGSDHISLVLLTTSSALIRGAVVFAEKMFEGESSFVLPRQPSTKIQVPLRPLQDTPIHMLAKVTTIEIYNDSYHKYYYYNNYRAIGIDQQFVVGGVPGAGAGCQAPQVLYVCAAAAWAACAASLMRHL